MTQIKSKVDTFRGTILNWTEIAETNICLVQSVNSYSVLVLREKESNQCNTRQFFLCTLALIVDLRNCLRLGLSGTVVRARRKMNTSIWF